MKITNAKYTQSGSITATVDDIEMSIPIALGNRHYNALIEQGIAIAPYVEPLPTKDQQEAARQSAYAKEADPLYFKWQAGESSQEAWVAKRAEIKSRYPYPELE